MDPKERRRRAGDEDADLVEEGVGGVEVAIGGEGCLTKREEECRGDALVYGVFSDIDKKEG